MTDRLRDLRAEMLRHRDALRASEIRFRNIIERNADGILIVDEEGVVRFVNGAAEKLLNRRAKALLGAPFGFPVVAGETTELDIVRRDGNRVVAEMRVVVTEWEGSRAYLASLRDVTGRKLAEEALAWEAAVNAGIARLSHALLSPASIEEISTLVLQLALRLTESAFGYVGYIDPKTGYLVSPTLTSEIWEDCRVPDKSVVFETFGGLWGWVLENQRSLLTNDPANDPRSTGTPAGHLPIRRFLSAPALIGRELVGQVALANPDHNYREQDLALVERLAMLYALALQRRRSEEALRRSLEERLSVEEALRDRNRQMALLHLIGQTFSSTLDLDRVLFTVLAQVRQLLDVAACSLWLQDVDTGELVCRESTGPKSQLVRGWRMAPGEGIAGWVMLQGQSLVVPDVKADARHFPDVDELTGLDLRSMLCIPLRVKEEIIGVLQVADQAVDRFRTVDLTLLEPLATSAAIAIENARLFEAEQKRRREAEALRHASLVLGSTLDVTEVFDQLLAEVGEVIPYESANVLLLEGEMVRIAHQRGYERFDLAGTAQDISLSVRDIPNLRRMLETRLPHIIPDTEEDPNWVPMETSPWVRAWAGAPLVVRKEVIGFFSLNSQTKGAHESEQIDLLRAFAAHAAAALENANLYEQVQSYAADLERRVAERTRDLQEANVWLQELDRLKSQFVQDVSHELRTPVTNISLYLHLLEQRPEKEAHYKAVLREQTKRLENLVRDIVNLSRLDTDSDAPQFEPVDLNDLVGQVVAAQKMRVKDNSVALIFEPHATAPVVRADWKQLLQVVTNLVDNALKYTPKGHVRVSTHLPPENGRAFFEVEDTGLGIAPQDLPHVFRRFYRGQGVGSSNIPGTGLGLAIVEEIVQRHGGEIDVESRPGEGSIFRVWLPLAQPQES